MVINVVELWLDFGAFAFWLYALEGYAKREGCFKKAWVALFVLTGLSSWGIHEVLARFTLI